MKQFCQTFSIIIDYNHLLITIVFVPISSYFHVNRSLDVGYGKVAKEVCVSNILLRHWDLPSASSFSIVADDQSLITPLSEQTVKLNLALWQAFIPKFTNHVVQCMKPQDATIAAV